ncbi:uncharacterized protein LOC133918221 isoform X2 [Phragmites australis]|uniref:uncharacterized protein LOC133918221 isoform X2 n=1 Tax=Phragmites australis TaxID=29695 RepID=UPI002D783969|nr:uncharacterized protein LOC133918221 isoform X2 [Phragmites australis]
MSQGSLKSSRGLGPVYPFQVFPDQPEKRRASQLFRTAIDTIEGVSASSLDDVPTGPVNNFFKSIRNTLDFDFSDDNEDRWKSDEPPSLYIFINSSTRDLSSIEKDVQDLEVTSAKRPSRGSGNWKSGGRRDCARSREMEPRGAVCRSSALLLLATILAAAGSSASAIGDKCAACKAVAAEIEIGISSEKPKNHLDLRNRLNSKGQREGKVIDYRVSELRVVELLDGLCDKMQDYTLHKLESGEKGWVKVTDWNTFQTENKAAARAHSKNLSTFCGRLLEETEDELAEWIKTSSELGNVGKALCEDISKHCLSTSATIQIEDEL